MITKKKKYKFHKSKTFWSENVDSNFKLVNSRLGELPHRNEGLSFLEIGSYEGQSACCLLDNVMKGADTLFCIEPFPLDVLKENLSNSTNPNYTVEEAFSFDKLSTFYQQKKQFDFIYIDGDHNAKGCLEDIILSWRILKKGGILLIDDYEMEISDLWFYKMHQSFLDFDRVNFIHPREAINTFRNIYRGAYEVIIDNAQFGIHKVCDI